MTNTSQTVISFVLRKADTALYTTVQQKLSTLQLITSIITSLVSLLALYTLGFRMTEKHIISRLWPAADSVTMSGNSSKAYDMTEITPVGMMDTASSVFPPSTRPQPILSPSH